MICRHKHFQGEKFAMASGISGGQWCEYSQVTPFCLGVAKLWSISQSLEWITSFKNAGQETVIFLISTRNFLFPFQLRHWHFLLFHLKCIDLEWCLFNDKGWTSVFSSPKTHNIHKITNVCIGEKYFVSVVATHAQKMTLSLCNFQFFQQYNVACLDYPPGRRNRRTALGHVDLDHL